jgi:hypothetical protein
MAYARIKLNVIDDRGGPSPFRAAVYRPNGTLKPTWSDTGSAQIETSPGDTTIVVRRGINYDAVELTLNLRDDETLSRDVVLRRRFSPRDMGWHGGENHMHVLHGKNDPPRGIADGGPMAAADGLEYLQLAYGWENTFSWVPADELNRQCSAASNKHSTIGWNIESPKCYMSTDDGGKSGNLHCYGHGWTVGLKDNSLGSAFFHTGPNFKIINEILRQGAIVGCAHPMRISFYKGNLVSNWASELPFDFVAGAPYAAIDILNDSPLLFFESERFWYTLLNLGYKVSGTGNSDGALGSTYGLGRYRTYTQIDGEFTWDKLADGMRDGRCIATSGPFVNFTVDGKTCGAEFASDGKIRKATIKAWSGALPGETLTSVQIVRNGEVVRAWDLRALNAREWETGFELSDTEFAWYAVRVLSSMRDRRSRMLWGPHIQELAVANPVYFLPPGFERPTPQPASVLMHVSDADSGAPLKVRVEAVVAGREPMVWEVSGERSVTFPATATLRISCDGYEPVERNVYSDCPEIFDYCRNMGPVWPSFFSPEPYQVLRQKLQHLNLRVTLKKK